MIFTGVQIFSLRYATIICQRFWIPAALLLLPISAMLAVSNLLPSSSWFSQKSLNEWINLSTENWSLVICQTPWFWMLKACLVAFCQPAGHSLGLCSSQEIFKNILEWLPCNSPQPRFLHLQTVCHALTICLNSASFRCLGIRCYKISLSSIENPHFPCTLLSEKKIPSPRFIWKVCKNIFIELASALCFTFFCPGAICLQHGQLFSV